MVKTIINESNPSLRTGYIINYDLARNQELSNHSFLGYANELSFTRIHNTVKSELVFNNCNTANGVVNFYFLILDSGNTYIFTSLIINDMPSFAGGTLCDIEILSEGVPDFWGHISNCFNTKIKSMEKNYHAKLETQLIEDVNTTRNLVVEHINKYI